MKSLKHISLLAFVLIAAMSGFGQKVKLEDGDLSPLKSEKTLGFAFTDDSMTIGSSGHGHPPVIIHTGNDRGGIRCKNTLKIIIKITWRRRMGQGLERRQGSAV
jgi:hypothetical protein